MSEVIRLGKVYYWIKLKMEFFRDKRIKKLRKNAGGDTYTIIYLKMLLLSLPNEGVLYFDGIEDDFAEEIALELEEEEDNVRMTLVYLLDKGLIERRSDDEYFLPQVAEMLGKEDESASRQRKRRQKLAEKRDNVTQLSDYVTGSRDIVQKCHTEIEIHKEKHIESHSEIAYRGECDNVILLDSEWKTLKQRFPTDYRERVDRLSRYIAKTGKHYASHYATIIRWADEDAKRYAATEKAAEQTGSFDTESFASAAAARVYGDL